ncbi:DUF2996 domain-containing protein [Leptolyngbya sp. AN02str]|uniref:DUF2996 domain-containing protein n=1 Tax=Leptolyngbya sp. AN02str TaxID=3423363 RepID=UPI003D3195C1
MPEDTQAQEPKANPKAAAGKPAGDKPAAKPAKEKPPALEAKPFQEFITQHFLPGLTKTMETLGVTDLNLAFDHKPLPIKGMEDTECWQVVGRFQSGQRQFMVGFLKDDLQSPKVFSCADNGSKFSLLESFMIDERKVTLDLLLLYTVQRLNGQKWLTLN